MIVKVNVPATGSIDSYINKPVKDRMSISAFDNSKEIGRIINAKHVNDEYELTMDVNIDININFNANTVKSFSIEI